MSKSNGLPPMMQYTPNGHISVGHSIYNRNNKTSPSKSIGVYPSLLLAQQAKDIATELTGTNSRTRMKCRWSKVKEAINEFRIKNGLKPIQQTYRQ